MLGRTRDDACIRAMCVRILVRKIALGEKLTYSNVRNFLLNLTDRVLGAKNELNKMDAACGDGDFGTSMFFAFSKVQETIRSNQSKDIGSLLTDVGQAVLSSAGGAAGPIFGILFEEAGKATKARTELELSDISTMFESSLRTIEARGGAKVGDKTLLDALDPAVASLKNSSAKMASLSSALEEAAGAAQAGYESTKGLVARQGKARYLAEQTLAHPDPGAYVTTLMFEGLRDELKQRR